MDMLDFDIRVVKALDEIGAPYMIVGAFGGTIFGITRATHDIDIMMDLREKDTSICGSRRCQEPRGEIEKGDTPRKW
jgi:hypothetical protein